MNIRQLIGKRIAHERIDKELSQEQLAELSKLYVSYIAKVERGEINIGLVNLQKICKGLSIKMADLFKGY